MACCGGDSLLNQLASLAQQIDSGNGGGNNSCCPPCCQPCPAPGPYVTTFENKPYVQCTMLTAPPCMIPTAPNPVKPLQLPCFKEEEKKITEQEAYEMRYSNFYNNYNEDYHSYGRNTSNGNKENECCPPEKQKGMTVDGLNPCCEDYRLKKPKKKSGAVGGCPTGFKPCTLKLTPPVDCDPMGIWCANVMPCPPKPLKKVSNVYNPGPCTRPCCKHWKPKDPPCLYDDPCRASCFDHPPGIKPSGRYP